MQKYLLSLAFLSLPTVAMLTKISTQEDTTSTHSSQPTIANYSLGGGFQWHEIVAELSNGDIITYTVFPMLNESTACIHAKTIDDAYETRENASAYWESQVKALYEAEKLKRKHNSYSIK